MKKHYLALDGLRGAVAICVVVLHMDIWLGTSLLLPRAYLAVDFFFVLSGFVVAYAYEKKLLGGLPVSTFMTIRLIRLLPMIFAAALIGAIYFLIRNHLEPAHYESLGYIVLAIIFGVVLIPLNLVIGTEGWPLNMPSWSLFFELVSNLIYALLGRRLSTKAIAAIIVVSAAGMCASAFLGIWSGAPKWASFTLTNRRVLWGTALDGLSRVGFGFFIGVVIYRLRNHRYILNSSAVHPALSTVLLIMIFAAPTSWPDYYNLIIAWLIFPLLVIGSVNFETVGQTAKLCKFGGWISYPMYAIHMPILFLGVGALKFSQRFFHISTPYAEVAFFGIIVIVACVFGKFYDEPVRQSLTRTFPRTERQPAPFELAGRAFPSDSS